MIKTFADEITKDIWEGTPVRKLTADIQERAREALMRLDSARTIYDLYTPRSLRFKALDADWNGWFQIRVNDQWRLRFQFDAETGEATRVWFGDWH